MKRSRRIGVALALLAAVVTTVAVPLAAADRGRGHHRSDRAEVVGYFIQWGIYGRNYFVKNVATSGSADRLSVINYAFINVAPAGPDDPGVVCKLGDEWADYQRPWTAAESVDGQEVTWPRPILGNFQQFQALKALYPNVKVLASLGGWTWSKYFSDAALTRASRERFVASCIDLLIKGDIPDPGWGGMGGPGAAAGVFDGIDLDWEWPGSEGNAGNIIRPEDKRNFTRLAREFRRQLDDYAEQTDRDYLLTAFLPAAPAKIDAGFEVDEIFESLDFGTVQGYDLHGAWETTTNHQSNLFTSRRDPASPRFSVDATVDVYLRRGAPRRALVPGVPFYSRGWTGVGSANHGLYQPATGPAPGVWEAGVNDYKVVKGLEASGFTRFFDGRAGAAWLYDGTTFWTLDDQDVMQAKARYVQRNRLGGLMFWELSGDTADGELIGAIADGLSDRGGGDDDDD
jgi:chitinase